MSKKEQNAPQHIKRTTGDWIFDIAVLIFFCIFSSSPCSCNRTN